MTQRMTESQAKEQLDKTKDEIDRQLQQVKHDENGTRMVVKRPEPKHPKFWEESPEPPMIVPTQEIGPAVLSIVLMEDMKHLFQFRLTLRVNSDAESLNLTELSLGTTVANGGWSTLELSAPSKRGIFVAQVPRVLTEGQMQLGNDGTLLQLRLPYKDDPSDSEIVRSRSLATNENINTVQCYSCQQPLLRSRPITRTAELPSGYWDEIADYLICYNGQPVVDFSTSSACPDPSVALQDSNVLCLHQQDLGGSACVLAVPGYGESDDVQSTSTEMKLDENMVNDVGDGLKDAPATFRGDRFWRDITGGATVCCTQCCIPLGFASLESPESFRFLKHRLSIPDSNFSTGGRRLSSCSSFVAREMVRYAESKAIFTFIVALDSPPPPPVENVANVTFAKCILLRLLSWDVTAATSLEKNSQRFKFRQFAKMVFEETHDRQAGVRVEGEEEEGTEGDVTNWVWGGIDLCCPPPNIGKGITRRTMEATNNKVSTVRIRLQPEEYEDLLENLRRGTEFFSQDVAKATIEVKMGYTYENDNADLGLTLIALDS